MKGYNEFIELFGGISVLSVAEVLLAAVFLYFIYKKVKDYLITKHESNRIKDEQLIEALTSVRKYPEYRKQSIEIQKELKDEIQQLRISQEKLAVHMVQLDERLSKSEEDSKIRTRNRLEDKLLEHYRHYTNPNTNPCLSWKRMESDAFWRLFKDYDNAGGVGYRHSAVRPAMMNLTVIDI